MSNHNLSLETSERAVEMLSKMWTIREFQLLSPGEKAVFSVMVLCCQDNTMSSPSLQFILQVSGIASKTTVLRHIRALQDRQFITLESKSRFVVNEKLTPNRYAINVGKIMGASIFRHPKRQREFVTDAEVMKLHKELGWI